jgi:hypothetical protein
VCTLFSFKIIKIHFQFFCRQRCSFICTLEDPTFDDEIIYYRDEFMALGYDIFGEEHGKIQGTRMKILYHDPDEVPSELYLGATKSDDDTYMQAYECGFYKAYGS